MTRYFAFIVGERICEFSTSRKSSLFRSCVALIRSSSGSSEPFGEYLDQTFFWNGLDLHRKLDRFASYYNQRRVHAGLGGHTPFQRCGRGRAPTGEST
jgi:hypothetical protein